MVNKEEIVKIECPESIWNGLLESIKEDEKKEIIEIIRSREKGISEKTDIGKRAKEELKKLRESLEGR